MTDVREKARVMHCTMCGKELRFASATTGHPGAPELIRQVSIRRGAWIGIVADEDGATCFVVACGDACRNRLLTDPPEDYQTAPNPYEVERRGLS